MRQLFPCLILMTVAFSAAVRAEGLVSSAAVKPGEAKPLSDVCEAELKGFPGPMSPKILSAACKAVQQIEVCTSVDGRPIFHYDKASKEPEAKRVLVFSLIHGDERPAGSVGRYWMERLESIDPRNTWRVVPVLNPDGVVLRSRMNANKVDINRTFPTGDWSAQAIKYWKSETKSNPRRFPGDVAGSEPETKCALKHIEEFKPDFIVSIHTPLRVLDYDGPKVRTPKFDYLPWKSLGHFPGSLGRYMWHERNTPVLTMELEDRLPADYREFEKLQDIIGTLTAIENSVPNATKKMQESK